MRPWAFASNDLAFCSVPAFSAIWHGTRRPSFAKAFHKKKLQAVHGTHGTPPQRVCCGFPSSPVLSAASTGTSNPGWGQVARRRQIEATKPIAKPRYKCRAGDDQPLQDMPGSYLNQIPQTATRSLHLGIPSVKHRFKRVEWAGTGRPAFDFQPHPGLKCQSQDIACCRKAQPAEAKEAYLRGPQLTLLILLRDRKEGSKQAAEKGIPNKQQEPYTPQAVISPGRN